MADNVENGLEIQETKGDWGGAIVMVRGEGVRKGGVEGACMGVLRDGATYTIVMVYLA